MYFLSSLALNDIVFEKGEKFKTAWIKNKDGSNISRYGCYIKLKRN